MWKQQPSAEVIVKEVVTVHRKREEFLCNGINKSQLIKLLLQYLKENWHTVIIYNDDADTKIAEAAVDFAFEKNNVTV